MEIRPPEDVGLISGVELEDALKISERLDARISAVALFVANAHNEFAGVESPNWRVESWSITEPYGVYPEKMCSVRLSVRWSNRPKTEKFGDPAHDDENYEYEDHRSSERLERYCIFPARYLYSNGWVKEIEERARQSALAMAKIHLEGLKPQFDQLAVTEKRLIDKRASLQNLVERLEKANK